MLFPTSFHRQALRLGRYGPPFLRRSFRLPIHQARSSWHVIGLTGSGKSRFLAGLYLELVENGLPATLIDPHGDLSQLVLALLVARGTYRSRAAYEQIAYLDLPAAERSGRFLPFNVLKAPGSPHSIASNIREAFHRAFPELRTGAPMFDTLVADGVKVLISAGLPLTSLYRLLSVRDFRERLLADEADPDIVSFFRDQYDRLKPNEQAIQAGAALRRAHLLTFNPVLKYSLSQPDNMLNFREILDSGRSAIINLALGDGEARRLFGCLLTVFAEQGALSRSAIRAEQRHGSHFLILDEFAEFVSQSGEALTKMLSQTRKEGLFVVMAHQTWSQADIHLRGALQNTGVDVVFQLGREDAEYTAKMLGRIDPLSIKHEVEDDKAVERTHPVFSSLPEQWEAWAQDLLDLDTQEAYVSIRTGRRPLLWRLLGKRASRRVRRLRTLDVPNPRVSSEELAQVEEEYLRRYFRPLSDIERGRAAKDRPLQSTGRWEKL